jgi:hypothetical protein
MRLVPQMPLASIALALSLLASGCLPGERANDPLPDVKADAVKADAVKTDVKADAKADDVADAGDDVTETADDVTETTGDGAPGCKTDDDCAALPTLPCHEAPTCKVATGVCESATSAENTPCAVDACFTDQLCDTAGLCSGGTAMKCDDKNACTLDLCSAGTCLNLFGDFACFDGDACTLNDHCSKDGGAILCVGTPLNCDDANVCTVDKCNATSGACQNQPFDFDAAKPVACVGNKPGTEAVCDAGTCGHAKDCDDKNACTDDNFNPITLACDHTFLSEAGCGTDKCNPGKCTLVDAVASCVTKPKCEDNKPCTVNKCNAADGTCDYKTTLGQGAACTSSDPCVGEGKCDAKTTCTPTTPVVCNDGNPCTDDKCTANVGCTGTPNSLACNDGTACTVSDICANGLCGGTAVNTDDGNACTVDACDPLTGVSHKPAPDGQSCGASSACSKGICVAQ